MKFTVTAGLLAAGLSLALAAPAQTTAPGPYYATPSWDQQLPAASRFVVLANWASQAVLDRETGLVWERDPLNGRNAAFARVSHGNAVSLCVQTQTGGRKGWRLPSISELQSLYDATGAPAGLMLPIGHPFLNVEARDAYWSASIVVDFPTTAFAQSFSTRGSVVSEFKATGLAMWCVRGPGGA